MVWNKFDSGHALGKVTKAVVIRATISLLGQNPSNVPKLALPPSKSAMPAQLRIQIQEWELRTQSFLPEIRLYLTAEIGNAAFSVIVSCLEAWIQI